MPKYPRKRVRRARKRVTAKPVRPRKREPSAANHNVIGSRDMMYQDTASTIGPTHHWMGIPPLAQLNVKISRPVTKTVPSLRSLCADTLARNADTLESAYLRCAPWSCWSQVWDKILALNNDSFQVYSLFAREFSNMPGFKAHRFASSNTSSRQSDWYHLQLLRRDGVSESRIPNCRNYRLENLFENIRLEAVIAALRVLSPLTLLDLSLVELTKEDYYMLFNFPRLIALDLSRTGFINDHYIHNILQCMSFEGKLPLLTTLRLTNCHNVSAEGVLEVLRSHTNLCYLECDHQLPVSSVKTGGRNYVVGTKWFQIDTDVSQLAVIARLPLGLKMHALFKYFSKSVVDDQAFLVKDTLDMLLLPHSFDYELPRETKIKLLESGWKARLSKRDQPRSTSYAYFYNANHKVVEKSDSQQKQSSKLQDFKVETKSSEIRKITRRRITADASSFFG